MAWAPDYVSLDALSSYLGLIDDTEEVGELAAAITAASRAVDKRCGRQFGVTSGAVERFYPAAYDRPAGVGFVETDDIASAAGLVVSIADVELDATDYRLVPRNAASKDRPWTGIEFTSGHVGPHTVAEVSVTAVYGWVSVPEPVKLATLLQAARFQARRQSVFGVAASPAPDGADIQLRAALDPDVYVMLTPYMRRVWAR